MSRRNYLTSTEAEEYADITIEDTPEAQDQISQAEEMIDAYVGFQTKHIRSEYDGQATGGTTTSLIDDSSDSVLNYDDDFYKYCEVEIIGGTNVGEKRTITASSRDNQSITVSEAFSSAIDETSIYVIRQLGKFPRVQDIKSRVVNGNSKYFKIIPEAVKRATAAQLQYIIDKGTEFFSGATDKQSERLDDYSYEVKAGAERLIAPKARILLKGIRNITGRIV